MSTAPTRENELLAAARRGDENAYGELVERHRAELHAHCYRMLGSVHDAEDALQDALLRAWRGLPRFQGRSSLRSWLYQIATNACLDVIGRRPKQRVLPIDYPAAERGEMPGRPLVESVWVEPYPDRTLGLEDGLAGPEARYEQRESVELAFVAALQHLPPKQRAALILRDVLGFSAKETAESLETTVPAANSALQRARETIDDRLPDQSQQATLRTLGDDGIRDVVEKYMEAMERCDVDAVVALLTEDAAWSMPPMTTWYSGRDSIVPFLAEYPLSGQLRWRHVPAFASGQPAVGSYAWDDDTGGYLPFALDVLTLRGDRISGITSFITRTAPPGEDQHAMRWPDQPAHERLISVFERLGLPARLD